MLRFLVGRSGFGKSFYFYQKACELAKNGKKTIIVLPDQFTFEAEKDILETAGAKLAVNIRVLSFSRLAGNIIEKYGGLAKKRISDSGKILSMNLAVDECRDQLEVLDADSAKLSPMMLETVEMLKSSGIGFDAISGVKTDDAVLSQKLKEIGLVYSAFDAIVKRSYTDPSDLIDFAARLVEKNDYFKGTTVFFDSFETFDSPKRSIIMSAVRSADDVFVSLCMPDPKGGRESFFNPCFDTFRKLKAKAGELSLAVSDEVITLTESHRFKSEELNQLEKYAFSDLPKCFDNEPNDIFVYAGGTAYDELEYTAATIRNLIMKSEYKYRDISVICADVASYAHSVESIFAKWHIPVHFSQAERIDSSPLVRFVFTAFNIVLFGFRTEDVLSYMKTGLLGLSGEEISNLENYAYVWKTNGKAWKSDFVKHPEGYGKKLDADSESRLEEINNTRKAVIEPLVKFSESIKDTDVVSICRAIFALLDENKVSEAIINQAEFCRKNNLADRADDGKRIWSKLMEVLDQFAFTLGESKIDAPKFYGYMKNILEVEETRDIPTYLDSVQFGSAIELLQSRPKVTFIIGCKRDAFPAVPTVKGLISESEKKLMRQMSIDLENPIEELTQIERFNAYKAVTNPSEKLYLTYNTSGNSKSEVIESIEQVFPKLEEIAELPPEYYLTTNEAAFSCYAGEFGSNNELSSTLEKFFENKSEYDGKKKALARSANQGKFEIEDKSVSARFLDGSMLSASRIETFYKCPFMYFCRYSLNAKKLEAAEIGNRQYGTIMHYILEKVLRQGIRSYIGNEKKLRDDTENYAKEYADAEMGGYETLGAQDKYRLARMVQAAYTLLLRLVEEFSQSKFDPKYFELTLKDGSQFPPLKITTEDGKTVSVGGVIDRFDVYTARDGSEYVRIVDYKTGSKDFKLAEVLYGLNMQMLIYLCAITDGGKYLPAGVLYMPAKIDSFSAKRDDPEAVISKERDKKQQMKGLLLDSIEVIDAMEKDIKGRFVQATLSKDNSLKKGNYLVNEKGFKLIFEYVRKTISNMAEEVLAGKCDADPVMVNSYDCEWCDYASVCLSKRDKNNSKNVGGKNDAVFETMEERLRGDENNADMD